MKIGWKVRGAVTLFRDMVAANVQCPLSNVQFSIQNCDAESLSAIGRSVFDVGCFAFRADFRRLICG